MRLIRIFLHVCALSAAAEALSFTVTSQIFMDIKQAKQPLGRITFGLFGKLAPKAVANFRHLCLRGINGTTYVGAKFHRVVNRFLIQGGDIINGDGTGTSSIYGEYFDDENKGLAVEHNRPGYLGMANRGPNTNGCQFYVSTVAAHWLNGKHTVIGKVMDGMDTISAIEDVKTDSDDYPIVPVVITNCGEIPIEPFEFYPDDYSVLGWIKAAGLPVTSSFMVLFIFHYFYRQLSLYC